MHGLICNFIITDKPEEIVDINEKKNKKEKMKKRVMNCHLLL